MAAKCLEISCSGGGVKKPQYQRIISMASSGGMAIMAAAIVAA